MTKFEIERSLPELGLKKLEALSARSEEFQAERWGRQIEADASTGKLDALADKALTEFHAGKTRPL